MYCITLAVALIVSRRVTFASVIPVIGIYREVNSVNMSFFVLRNGLTKKGG